MAAENFWLTLQADFTDQAPEGPGWYVYAARQGTVLIPLRRLSRAQVAVIGQAFETVFDGDAQQPPVLPSQLVSSGNELIRKTIDTQLAQAEAMAVRIAKLRELQAAEREDTEESNQS